MTAAIAVESLVKSYGERRVVDDVSLEVRAGEVVALLGPNGAGKTTTVEIIEGYRHGDAGRVTVLGADPERAGREHRARIGLVLQGGGGVDPRLTPLEVLRLHAAFHAAPRDPAELVAMVGLADAAGTRFRRLSGGERQRLGVALALVGRPDVVILDEPTAGMDIEGRALMRDVLASLRADGVAVLMTSHDLADVERVADRIVILARGRVVAAGTLDELRQASSSTISMRLPVVLADADLLDLSAALGAT
ncbi:MAG TPA: ABC transporter ATP-binding protein, partial [Candidatus Limnocylindrales bacterium]